MSDDEIKGRNDFAAVAPPPPRSTSLPPQGKVWQVAGPFVLQGLILSVTLVAALTRHVTDEFLQKMIEWSFVGVIASATPKGVLDAIKTMAVRE